MGCRVFWGKDSPLLVGGKMLQASHNPPMRRGNKNSFRRILIAGMAFKIKLKEVTIIVMQEV